MVMRVIKNYNRKTSSIEIEIIKDLLEYVEIIANESGNPELAKNIVTNALDVTKDIIEDAPFFAIPRFKFAIKNDWEWKFITR